MSILNIYNVDSDKELYTITVNKDETEIKIPIHDVILNSLKIAEFIHDFCKGTRSNLQVKDFEQLNIGY
jgi:hypothetical protein